MRNPRGRYVPLAILPSILLTTLLPVMRSFRVPNAVLGGAIGVLIGLSIVGLVWLSKGKRSCSSRDGLSN